MNEPGYVERLRQAMEASREPRFSADYTGRCCAYAEALIKRGLPVLFDARHVRQVLRLEEIQENCYHEFEISKGDGTRTILAPSRPLKARQRWVYKNILLKLTPSGYAHGFTSGRSILTNARIHIGQPYTLCIDIADFFPSISAGRVVTVFRELGYSQAAAAELGRLCTHDGCLPQGAPTSPCLSNIICRDMDRDLYILTERFDCIFSRYADDITFSAGQELTPLLPEIQRILHSHGFALNEGKCRTYGPGQPKHITGLVVQEGVRIPKGYRRKLKQEIHYCQRFGVTVHLENTNSAKCIHYREYLYGKAYFIKMVEPELGQHFLEELEKIDWPA